MHSDYPLIHWVYLYIYMTTELLPNMARCQHLQIQSQLLQFDPKPTTLVRNLRVFCGIKTSYPRWAHSLFSAEIAIEWHPVRRSQHPSWMLNWSHPVARPTLVDISFSVTPPSKFCWLHWATVSPVVIMILVGMKNWVDISVSISTVNRSPEIAVHQLCALQIVIWIDPWSLIGYPPFSWYPSLVVHRRS